MSTLLYGVLTSKREEAAAGTSEEVSPGVKTFVDGLAALVPAEVLAAHAAIIPMTTASTKDDKGQVVTTITDSGTLVVVFFALMAVSMFLYMLGRWKDRDKLDFVRVFIPPLAFAGWTMLQKATAFDALAPDWSTGARFATAIIGALVLGGIATALAYKADSKPQRPAPDPAHV